jgi:geranylgeranyl pyrophosphate synthase
VTAEPRPDETGSAPALAEIAPLLAAGGPALARLLALTEERLLEVASGHGEELGRHAAGTLAAGGKRLRPTLVFLAGGCAGADGAGGVVADDGSPLVRAGVAIELLHMATLVHDDVLDRAPLRRGQPTVYREAGRAAATATGDLLFSRAFAELVTTGDRDAVRALSDASSALARGELMQREDAWSPGVTRERYLERCTLKTARLFDAACRLGALLGSNGGGAADGLGAYGQRVGVAFQILDDVLDVAGPPERTGKDRGTDLLDGTVTLPLILARERDPDLAALDLRSAATSPEAAATLCDRIAATGALEDAREEALRHVSAAKQALTEAPIDPNTRAVLALAADGVAERYS